MGYKSTCRVRNVVQQKKRTGLDSLKGETGTLNANHEVARVNSDVTLLQGPRIAELEGTPDANASSQLIVS